MSRDDDRLSEAELDALLQAAHDELLPEQDSPSSGNPLVDTWGFPESAREESVGFWPPRSFVGALHAEDRRELLRLGTAVRFEPHAALVAEGDPAGGPFYILLDGFAKITAATTDGDEALLAVRTRGDVIGEFPDLDGGPRTATVSAAGAVVARRIDGVSIRAYLERNEEARQVLVNSVLGKMRVATELRTRLKGDKVVRRLAQVLLELASSHGMVTSNGVTIGLPLSQFQLSWLVSAAESATERTLRELREEGIIQVAWRRVTVLDMDRLRERAVASGP